MGLFKKIKNIFKKDKYSTIPNEPLQEGHELILEEQLLEENQTVEVDFDKELVKEYEENYIMEEEGIGAEDEEPYDKQTHFNKDKFEDMINPEEVTILDEES